MCCDGSAGRPEDKVGQCPECEGDVDIDGNSVEACCFYSPRCGTCGWSPCDSSC